MAIISHLIVPERSYETWASNIADRTDVHHSEKRNLGDDPVAAFALFRFLIRWFSGFNHMPGKENKK